MLDVDQYPLPTPDQLLAGGKTFTTLDLSQAYQQLPLDEESKQYDDQHTPRTVSLHKDAVRDCLRLSDFPEAHGPGAARYTCYIDDILVTGPNDSDHLQNLATVLQQLQEHGFRLKNIPSGCGRTQDRR